MSKHHARQFILLFTSILLLEGSALAAPDSVSRYVLTDHMLLKKLKIDPLTTHDATGTSLVLLTEKQREDLAHEAHEHGRCSGHELVSELPSDANLAQARAFANQVFGEFNSQQSRDAKIKSSIGIGIPTPPTTPTSPDPEIEKAILELSEQNLRDTVNFLAQYPSRNHKSGDGQKAIQAFKARVEDALKGATVAYTLDFIAHTSTPMNSLRLTFTGAVNPDEVVVAGAHIDSINSSYFGSKSAPGADDNASGSANILEAARVLAHSKAPNRTIEFYWYAGEEGGLLGSAEIAKAAKAANKKVVGVLQLDMTLFPGDGEFKLGSMTDFTSQDMRDLLTVINRDYLGATIVEDKCGYGCSDHASWYRNGYPTLMPFEATMKRMNGNIHTDKDTVSASLSFRHSMMFSKIALAFLMTLSR